MVTNEVVINAERRSARAGLGAVWADVVSAAAAHGLTTLHGAADGDVICDSLAGGLNWQSRLQGRQCDAMTAVELITPAGELVRSTDLERIDEDCVVVAVEFDLFPLTEVYAGSMSWDESAATAVCAEWVAWARTAPDAVTSTLRLADGRVTITGCIVAGPEEGDGLMAPLRGLDPEFDAFGPLPPSALLRLAPAVQGAATVLTRLDAAMIDDLVAATLHGAFEVRHLGGALSDAEGSFLMTVEATSSPLLLR